MGAGQSGDYVRPPENSESMYKDSRSNPAIDCENITPNDTTVLTPTARALRVGVAGNVTIVTPRGTSVLFTAVQAGEILPCLISKLMATGTTATGFVAFYG